MSNALAQAPENAAYGLLAFAPLGAVFAPTAIALALLGGVIANAAASVLGPGRVVVGQGATLALLTAGLITALLGPIGPVDAASSARVLALCALGVVGAGALQALFGLLRAGSIVKYTPYPVRVGLTSAVGLVLIATALPVVAGHGFGGGWRTAFDAPQPGAVLIGLFAIAVTALSARWRRGLPPVLVGLAAATGLHAVLAAYAPGAGLGGVVGNPVWPAQGLLALDWRAFDGILTIDARQFALVGAYSVAVAVLCSLDALLVVSVVDGQLRQRRDANRELRSQGLANILAGLVSSQPVSSSMNRTLALVVPHAHERQVVLFYAAALLLLAIAAPQWLGHVPLAAIGGLLLQRGVQMVAPAFGRASVQLRQLRRRRRENGSAPTGPLPQRRGDWAIEIVIVLSTLAFGLAPAILIGASCAVLLFVHANMRDVVRREWSAQTRRSLKARVPAANAALDAAGARIRVLELEGSLFFGTADGLRARLDAIETTVDAAVLDLHLVADIDVTAARILVEAAEQWQRAGKWLAFAEWPPGDGRRRRVEAVASVSVSASASASSALRFLDTTDLALEQAEELQLQSLVPHGERPRALTLAETMLGQGLTADELDRLAAEMRPFEVPRGQLLFRVGDPSDGLYVVLQGDIGLRLPGSTRRLASFAAGVVIGEMATLARVARSAEAYAEADVVGLRLPVEGFDRLLMRHPVLAAKLLKNISLYLAVRVRALTVDLSHWTSRRAVGRQPPAVAAAGAPPPQADAMD